LLVLAAAIGNTLPQKTSTVSSLIPLRPQSSRTAFLFALAAENCATVEKRSTASGISEQKARVQSQSLGVE
jgi:hypothetical protein